MTEAGKNNEMASPARWGIFDRLKNLPYLFSTGDSGVNSARTVKGETTKTFLKKTVSTETKQVDEEIDIPQTPVPEEEQWDMLSKYENIRQNEFAQRGHVVQKEDDIAVCVCAVDTECKELCLNTLTSVECTPGHCPCGNLCKNQKFQKSEYAKVQMVKTDGRGWGLFADQDIRKGDFVIEYCGEVVSDKVAQSRVHVYEEAGVKDKYIITLDGNEFLDATRKGSLARFINHSCEPNCVTRKWTVLGEVRIGIFALRDIKMGEELTYDYNFQWFGGNKIECRCGAPSCVGYLGAKSRGFQDIFKFEEEDGRDFDNNARERILGNHEGASSNRELLNQLYAMAVGIRSFQVVGAKPKLTQLVGEVKDKRVRAKKITPEKKAEVKKEVTPKLKKTPSLKERRQTETLLFSPPEPQTSQQGVVLEWISPQVDVIQLTQKFPGGSSVKKAARAKVLKAKLPLPENDEALVVKKKTRKVDATRGGSDEQFSLKKKARMAGKNVMNQRLQALSFNQRPLSEAASAEVAAAQEQEVAAAAELTKLLDEIRSAMKDREQGDYNAIPFELTERWVAASTKQLCTSFDYHSTVVRHMLGSMQPSNLSELGSMQPSSLPQV